MIKEKERFVAVSEEGEEVTIICYQHYARFRPLETGKTEYKPSRISYQTDTGSAATLINRDTMTFQVIQTDQIVRKL